MLRESVTPKLPNGEALKSSICGFWPTQKEVWLELMNYYEDTPRFISSLLDVVDLLTAARSTDSTRMKSAHWPPNEPYFMIDLISLMECVRMEKYERRQKWSCFNNAESFYSDWSSRIILLINTIEFYSSRI